MNEFANRLIDWYKINKRDLPWRKTKDPYRIWISEIILQQTRVAQGYAYYLRFIQRFPDVFVLASADEDEVMKYWQGLGYYSRARNLYAAAKSIAEMGAFPKDYEKVLALKGIGEYTAAAICSFAYDLPYAVVDGNVYRILSRWLGMDIPIDSNQGKKQFALAANELLDKDSPAIYNQAIMDFGALQCTPVSPDCTICPLSDSCMALAQGKVDTLPVKKQKTKMKERFFNYIYVRVGTYTFVRKRTANDIWRNLYEPLLLETEKDFSGKDERLLQKVLDVLKNNDGGVWNHQNLFWKPIKEDVKHVLSHRIVHANFYELVLPEGEWEILGYQKVSQDELYKFAVSNLVSHFFSLILEPNH